MNRKGIAAEMETIRKNEIEIIEMRNVITKLNTFGGLTSRFDTAEERIHELEDRSIEIAQIEIQREKRVGI